MPEFLKEGAVIEDLILFAMAGALVGGFMWAGRWEAAESLGQVLIGAAIMRFRRR